MKFGGSAIVWGSLIALVGLIGLLMLNSRRPAAVRAKASLMVFCAVSLKGPLEATAREYERETGVSIQIQYGGSGTLLGNLKVAQKGDLFIAADGSFIDLGRSNRLLGDVLPLAHLHPVLAVARGNPRGLHGLEDLLRPEVRVSLANPDSVAIGAATRRALTPSGKWEPIAARATVFKPTVNDVANDLKLGSVDAGVVWDVTIHQYPELEAIEVPEFRGVSSDAAVAVLAFSAQSSESLNFARYLAASDRGLRHFAAVGFNVVAGNRWSSEPAR